MSLRRPAKPVVMGTAWLLIMLGAIVAGAIGLNPRNTAAQSSAASANVQAQTQQPPAVSPLGARNDLPNPYLAGVSWGRLPNGRSEERRVGKECRARWWRWE